MPIGLMSAMQEENSKLIAELGEDHHVIDKGMRRYHVGSLWEIPVVVVFSRWGKVAAATTATCLITEFNVGEIIFTGVAGGADPEVRVGDVVVATGLCQHDMDARPLFPRHEIPLIGRSTFQSDISRRVHAVEATKRFFLNDLVSHSELSIHKSLKVRSRSATSSSQRRRKSRNLSPAYRGRLA